MRWTVFLAAAVCATSGFGPMSDPGETPLVLETAVMDDCILLCVDDPDWCSANDHDAWDSGGPYNAGWGEGGRHAVGSPCWPGTCLQEHPCAPEFAATELEALRLALLEADGSTVKATLDNLGVSAVLFDAERSAIQILGCNGAVVAHLPVTKTLAATLLTNGS